MPWKISMEFSIKIVQSTQLSLDWRAVNSTTSASMMHSGNFPHYLTLLRTASCCIYQRLPHVLLFEQADNERSRIGRNTQESLLFSRRRTSAGPRSFRFRLGVRIGKNGCRRRQTGGCIFLICSGWFRLRTAWSHHDRRCDEIVIYFFFSGR